MNFAQFFSHIGQHLCSPEDNCAWKTIAVAIEAISTYFRQVNDFLYILQLDADGCKIVRPMGDLILDLAKEIDTNEYEEEDRKRALQQKSPVKLGPGLEKERENIEKVCTCKTAYSSILTFCFFPTLNTKKLILFVRSLAN